MTLIGDSAQHITLGLPPTPRPPVRSFNDGYLAGRTEALREMGVQLAARDAKLAAVAAALAPGRRTMAAQAALRVLATEPKDALVARERAQALATSEFVRDFRADMWTEDGYTEQYVEGFDAATRELSTVIRPDDISTKEK